VLNTKCYESKALSKKKLGSGYTPGGGRTEGGRIGSGYERFFLWGAGMKKAGGVEGVVGGGGAWSKGGHRERHAARSLGDVHRFRNRQHRMAGTWVKGEGGRNSKGFGRKRNS